VELAKKPSDIKIDYSGNIHYIDENGSKIVRMDLTEMLSPDIK